MPLPARNLLAEETSPYLLQHSGNPVHWRPWTVASLDEARRLNRPILLSIGYAACHWCHVMAHESFEDEGIAALMNRHFVNIKVDREERPDIDQIYMATLSAMGEQGGWPLTMFLTPDARPFWGGTYFPPSSRYGRPGFADVLRAIDKAWTEQRDRIVESSEALASHVKARLGAIEPRAPLDPAQLTSLADGIYDMIDHRLGGLKGAPKFPNAPFMQTLWLSWLRDGNQRHRDAVIQSTAAMLRGGIYDHIGGGLARYSTDAAWLVPHFEKMLYDNAQLIRLSNWLYAATGDDLFRLRIEGTADWLIREMRKEDGSFASSLDADSEAEEGLFYVWDERDIADAAVDRETFSRFYTLEKPENWEGKPVVAQTEAQAAAEILDPSGAAALKRLLLAHRQDRVSPGRDDKTLVDWNGLAIVALAEAGRALDRPEWIEAAAAAFFAILDNADGTGRLPHSFRSRNRLFPALSSDYAAMANAAVALFEATQDARYVGYARRFISLMEQWHRDEDNAAHYLTAADSADTPMRIRGDIDEAMPSATSQIVEALSRLSSITGDMPLHDRAILVAEHAIGRASKQSYGQAGIVNAAAILMQPLKLVIVENPASASLVPVANRNPDPRRVDIRVAPGSTNEFTSLPGLYGQETLRPGAYLCAGQVCFPRIENPTQLDDALKASAA